MPVCERDSRMVGIISERDLVRVFARADWNELQSARPRRHDDAGCELPTG
jgi:CBS domain-containing protein